MVAESLRPLPLLIESLDLVDYFIFVWGHIKWNSRGVDNFVNQFFDKIILFIGRSRLYEKESSEWEEKSLALIEKWAFLCSSYCWEGLKKRINSIRKDGKSNLIKNIGILDEISEWPYIKNEHYLKEAIFVSRLLNNHNSFSLDEFKYLKLILENLEKQKATKRNFLNYKFVPWQKYLFLSKGREEKVEWEKSIKECLKILGLLGCPTLIQEECLVNLIKKYKNEIERMFKEYRILHSYSNERKADRFWEDKTEEQIDCFLDCWKKLKQAKAKEAKAKDGLEKLRRTIKDKEDKDSYDPILFPNITYNLCVISLDNNLISFQQKEIKANGFGLLELVFFLLIGLFFLYILSSINKLKSVLTKKKKTIKKVVKTTT